MIKLLCRKECLRLTLAGWLLILLLLGTGGGLILTKIHGFLTPVHPMGGDMLVIEGWLPDAELWKAIARLERGHYRFIVTTGGPLERGGLLSEYHTYAQLSLASLQKMGVGKPMFAVPSPDVQRDRTYASALALRYWLKIQFPEIRTFDLITAGAHARRSHLLFCKAFGADFNIGIIALPPSSYDASSWWASSAGVRSIIGEGLAWFYAALLFSPSDALSS